MEPTKPHPKETAETAAHPTHPTEHHQTHPTEKKNKKSSRGARRLRDVESRVSKSVHRMTKAVNKGVETYLEARDKSDERRRDGFAVDFFENVAKGVSNTVAEGAPIIHDVAEAFNSRRLRKQIRSAVSTFGNLPLIGG